MLPRLVAILLACCAFACGCEDVPVGRQIPRDGGLDVRLESVIPTPDAAVTLRALDLGPGGEIVLLLQFEGSADFGDGDRRTATSAGGDGALLVFEPSTRLRAKRVLAADFLTLYRGVVDGSAIHLAGLFRGALSDGDALGDSPSSQTAVAARYDLAAERTGLLTLSSASGFGNVQGKGVDARGDAWLRCGNYLDVVDAGDGPMADAGVAGDNVWVTVADATGTRWTRALETPEGAGVRGAYGQNCAFTPDGGVVVGVDFDASVSVGGSARSAEALDGLVVAYDADGAPRWDRVLGGPGGQELNPIATRAGLVVVGGSSSAPFAWGGATVEGSLFVAALGLDGAPRWAWSVGGAGPYAVTDLDGSGADTVASGFFGAPVDALGWAPVGERDGFVLGLDDAGAVRWSHTFGSAGADTCLGHASGDELVVVCRFGAGLVSPGGAPIPDGGALWIARLGVD